MMTTEPLSDDGVGRPPSGSEIEIVELISARRVAEQTAIALRGALKNRGYTDIGLNRWIAEHFAALRRAANLKGSQTV